MSELCKASCFITKFQILKETLKRKIPTMSTLSTVSLNDFLDYLEEQVDTHSGYVWGAQGQTYPKITQSWIYSREKNTGNDSNGNSYYELAIAFWKKQCDAGYEKKMSEFDCSGLGAYFFYNLHKLISGDTNAHGFMSRCTLIPSSDLKPGCFVFRVNSVGRATHVGYVVKNNYVIHAKGRAYGVVKEKFKSSYWHKCGVPNFFKTQIEGNSNSNSSSSSSNSSSSKTNVLILRKSVSIRSSWSTLGKRIGFGYKGDTFEYLGTAITGWYKIKYNNGVAYISNRLDLTKLV